MEELGLQFKNKRVYQILFLLVIQQVVVASSSYWLIGFTHSLNKGVVAWDWLSLYLLSLLLPYIPGVLALYALKLLEIETLKHFWRFHQAKLASRIDLHSNLELKTSVLAAKVKDGPQLITEAIHFGYELMSIGLNVSLNILAISWLLNPLFLASYLISVVLAALMIWLSDETNSYASSKAEKSKIQLTSVLGRAWDNLVINNQTSRKKWEQEFRLKFTEFKLNSVKSERERQRGTVALTLAAFVPSMVAIFWFVCLHQKQISVVLSLVVLLPRVFMVLNQTGMIVYLIRDMALYRGRMKQISVSLRLPARTDLRERWDLNRIHIKNSTDLQGRELSPDCLPPNGWFSVSGSNGVGKSSWLCHLKQRLGEQAFYYPARAELDILDSTEVLSTGQKTVADLKEILERETTSVLLLDEWDAHLDHHWRAEIEQQIRAVSERRLVIDVRHRG